MKKRAMSPCAALLAGAIVTLPAARALADEAAASPGASSSPGSTQPDPSQPVANPPPSSDTPAPVDPASTPAPAFVAIGPYPAYRPFLRFEPKGMLLQADFLLAARGEAVTAFPIDREGTRQDAGVTLSPLLRAGIRFNSGKVLPKVQVHAEYEHDLPTGQVSQWDAAEGSEMPSTAPIEQQLRKLYARLSLGPLLHVGGGFMTNQFGLGLLANDGAQTSWTPGSARFADNRGGDRVLRGFVGTGPLTPAQLTATIAFDQVQADDVLLPGDEAIQIIGMVSVGYDRPWGAGVFIVHRRQEAPDGAHTEATVVDLAARYSRVMGPMTFSLEGEAAVVVGETTLAPTPEFPVHDILQVGAAIRAAARFRHAGGVIDFLYASGDGSPDDNTQTAFKADPNFETGLLLYRHVLAAQTGRATVTAADLDLVGVPSPGLERVPTRGSPTNTIAVFPRAYVRPVDGLEVYGGPLLAFAAAPLTDPLNTRVGGGVGHSALGGRSGSLLGVELDLGVRFRTMLRGSELTIGVEGAGLAPGDAFKKLDGTTMGGVFGGRALLQYRL